MYEFSSSAGEMEMKFDECVSGKCLNEGTAETFLEILFFFYITAKTWTFTLQKLLRKKVKLICVQTVMYVL